jgi:5-methyltetrahydrofolate corrinoid/iron sulfur protein methyltransferase
MMLEEIAPGAMSTCGLSNISNGPPVHLRPILNTTYMIMLERYGMKAVISDPLDTNLTAVAKGKRPDIVEVVHQAMDGSAPDPATLPKELGDYVKTVKVILGETLFSDSYLEI